jgi:hypothetical protein
LRISIENRVGFEFSTTVAFKVCDSYGAVYAGLLQGFKGSGIFLLP